MTWEGGREAQEEGDRCIYIELIHSVVQQKVTQHCNVIVLQFKKKKKMTRHEERRSEVPVCTEPATSSLRGGSLNQGL